VRFIPSPQARVMLSLDLPGAASQKAHTGSQGAHLRLPVSRPGRYSRENCAGGVQLGTTAGIDYRLLGAIEAGVNGHVLDIGGQKQRALLAILLLSANKPVTRDVLVDRLWGQRPPAGAQHTLEVYVSRLRKTLEPAAGCPVVLTRPGAYLLRATREHIDVRRFERLASEGRRVLAANAPGQAAADLREALALWRGEPLADISYEHSRSRRSHAWRSCGQVPSGTGWRPISRSAATRTSSVSSACWSPPIRCESASISC